ncbi:hypothetical protein PAAG_02378 [Paracoccidioides lutzii Pb01]|uniref:Uncharacterized protein n=1 Tax=Paracoccidioides lutzii (strain ATCC MYA-826 / Pb01) TaxID=502779 RepID=C1GUQ5_PARBA|nr:hypothetical protein PAAG_02378 [Paracoccidioides lutzii Pb01]EEH40323.2 hypothetical protein PAAG_02378 [Paracoccidioides lutzii Pb01]
MASVRVNRSKIRAERSAIRCPFPSHVWSSWDFQERGDPWYDSDDCRGRQKTNNPHKRGPGVQEHALQHTSSRGTLDAEWGSNPDFSGSAIECCVDQH